MPPAARGSFEKPPLDPAKLFIFVGARFPPNAVDLRNGRILLRPLFLQSLNNHRHQGKKT